MNYFDLHSDTLTALYDKGETFDASSCHISSKTISEFDSYRQVFAIFSKSGLSDDECFDRFFKVQETFSEYVRCGGHILSVEDGRLLAGDVTRLDELYRRGVRILTPLWGGITCIGGAHDTNEGLSPFGRDVVERCIELGIVPDISHASVKSANEIIDISKSAGVSVMASHSNSYEVCPHSRNIDSKTAKKVAEGGGVIGVCFHAPHLNCSAATIDDIVTHIKNLIYFAGEDAVCIGADFDGTDLLPAGIDGQGDIPKAAGYMEHAGIPTRIIEKVYYNNAERFFSRVLQKERL